MAWPWISRAHHAEVIAGKNEVIHTLQRQIASLEAILQKPIPVEVKVEMPTVQSPGVIVRRAREPREEKPAAKPVDWANVNVDDPVLMASMAAEEFGYQPSPYILSQWLTRVRKQHQDSKREQTTRRVQKGQTGTVEAPPGAAPFVPQHVLDDIAAAENV